MSADKHDAVGYWRANVRIIVVCLVVWALCSYGFGIILRPLLAGISIGGTDLGFWFAQQGAIYVFVILIFVYVKVMTGIDEKYGVNE